MTIGAPADETYNALSKRLGELQREAGAFLARSLRPNLQESTRKGSLSIAEDFAREALEVADEMKAWRLANGWEA